MKAERQYKEATSRVIQSSKGSSGHIVDNRPQALSQAKEITVIQSKIKNGKIPLLRESVVPIQMALVLKDPPAAEGEYSDEEQGKKGFTFFCKSNSSLHKYLYSRGYGSCVGLSFWKQGSPSIGMLVHFWAASKNMLAEFTADLEAIQTIWAELGGGGIIRAWNGAQFEHPYSVQRMKKIREKIPGVIIENHTNAYLNLENGIVTNSHPLNSEQLGVPKARRSSFDAGTKKTMMLL